VQLPGE